MEKAGAATIAAMNTPRPSPRFEPVDPLPHADGAVLHESARTGTSRNIGADGRSTIAVAMSRLKMQVENGALVVAFVTHKTSALPARRPLERVRRGRLAR